MNIDKERLREIIDVVFTRFLVELWVKPRTNTEFREAKRALLDLIDRQPSMSGEMIITDAGRKMLEDYRPEERK